MGKRKKGTGRAARKAKSATGGPGSTEALDKAPHSFIFHRGKVGRNVRELIQDIRKIYEPFTASDLKVKRKNVLKDYVSVAGLLHVSHFAIFTKTDTTLNLRVARTPHGPTLTFRVEGYTLARDVMSSLRRQYSTAGLFNHSPLLVMNGLTGEGLHFKLMASMFQNMFPSIDVATIKLSSVRRCVLLNYDQKDETLELRHYNIRVVPMGMSRGVKKLLKKKKEFPNLSRFKDMSEFLNMGGGDQSESEAELDGPDNEVNVAEDLTKGPVKPGKSAVRLTEIGPRLRLKLIKIEEGFCSGNVLYHKYVVKTEDDIEALKKFKAKKKKIKDERRLAQEKNVKRKKEEKEMNKIKSLAGMKKTNIAPVEEVSSDDDAEYYENEVGEKPVDEIFNKKNKGGKHKAKFSFSMTRNSNKLPTTGKISKPNEHQDDKNSMSANRKRGKQMKENKFKKNEEKDPSKKNSSKPMTKRELAEKLKQKKPLTDIERIQLRKKKKVAKIRRKSKRKPGLKK